MDWTYSDFLFQDGMNEQANITTEMANRMSLFYAYPTPLLRTISDATTKFVSSVSFLCSLFLLYDKPVFYKQNSYAMSTNFTRKEK